MFVKKRLKPSFMAFRVLIRKPIGSCRISPIAESALVRMPVTSGAGSPIRLKSAEK